MVIFHSYLSLPEGTKRCCNQRHFKAKGPKSSSSFAQAWPIAGAWTVTSPAGKCGDAARGDLKQECPISISINQEGSGKIMEMTSMKHILHMIYPLNKCHSISILGM